MKAEDIENYCEPVPESGCWVWTRCVTHNGYGDGLFDGKRKRAHRAMYEMAYGPIPEGIMVLHTCDVRSCCNPAHLFLGTAKDNTQDMVIKGRATSKMTSYEVEEALRLRADGLSAPAIVAKLGLNVTDAALRYALRGDTWGHI